MNGSTTLARDSATRVLTMSTCLNTWPWEWYHAYWDWQDGMKFMEKMYKYVLKETFGKLHFQIGDFDVDLDKKWEVWDYADVIKKHFGIDVYNTTLDEVKSQAG